MVPTEGAVARGRRAMRCRRTMAATRGWRTMSWATVVRKVGNEVGQATDLSPELFNFLRWADNTRDCSSGRCVHNAVSE